MDGTSRVRRAGESACEPSRHRRRRREALRATLRDLPRARWPGHAQGPGPRRRGCPTATGWIVVLEDRQRQHAYGDAGVQLPARAAAMAARPARAVLRAGEVSQRANGASRSAYDQPKLLIVVSIDRLSSSSWRRRVQTNPGFSRMTLTASRLSS